MTPTPTSRRGIGLDARAAAVWGAALAALAVALGAFGAHALDGVLVPARMHTFETAVRYQMFHALGLLLVGALPRPARTAAMLLLLGSLVFSGSLYLLVATDTPALGAVAPIGGALQIAGWIALALSQARGEARAA
jgi:uncharacterized membrane protein YgdD (TMEM256/DUF423 family)